MARNNGHIDYDRIYVLQNRWKIARRHIVYYGIRKAPDTFKNSVPLTRGTLKKLAMLDGNRSLKSVGVDATLKSLIRKGIVVPQEEYKPDKKNLEEAEFCANCTANDYMIPGLELDENGLCPMCSMKERLKNLKAVMPVRSRFPRNKRGEYDVALFYTGGKDSTYLLYYLCKVLGLRVLALCWETEYISPNAAASIENARKLVKNADIVVKKVDKEVMRRIYARHYALAGNTCMCPSLAYVLFYPLLTDLKVPYLVLGNEPSQMYNLIFNNISPIAAFRPWVQNIGRALINVARLISFRKPFKAGQMQTYFTVRTLAKGTPLYSGGEGKYHNEQVHNVFKALADEKEFMQPFKESVRRSWRNGNIPELVHVDLAEISGGYKWSEIKTVIKRETGWQDCADADKGLHTSCSIEKCKEYTQFTRFKEMRSRVIPFTAIEMAIAVRDGNVSREDAMREILTSTGFFDKPPEYEEMLRPLKENESEPD